VLQGDRILDAARLTGDRVPATMRDTLAMWGDAAPTIRNAAQAFADGHREAPMLPADIAVPVWESVLECPVPQPPTFRDFFAFEEHARIGFERRGRTLPDVWYERPIFFFGNSATFQGTGVDITKPSQTRELDFEAEIALVIGIGGQDITADSAMTHVAGFMLLNDWSARDIQRAEAAVGLGPSKGKDFATSAGPWLVTPEEFGDRLHGGRLDVDVSVRVHGDTIATSSTNSMHWSFADLVAEASRGVPLQPGDVIASGTVPRGCLYELGEDVHPWLEPGDDVEIEATGLGRLRNRIS
jgi:fumarylacetoacetate (FAA) hydrolase